MNKKPKIVVIVGPTASGKSDLAIKLARRISAKGGPAHYRGAEIISADSRQVYHGMDIGTGKIKRDTSFSLLNKYDRIKIATNKKKLLYYSMGIHHYLIDVVSPKKIFTVSDFKSRAEKAITDITKRNKLPIVVGGTGQYIDTLIYNFSLPKVPPNYELRAQFDKLTVEQLFEKLKKLDPERAKNIERHNPRRLIRALEIISSIGKVPPLNTSPISHNTNYDVLWLGLNPKDLQKRIATRLSARFRQGMIAEVKKLRANGISWQRLYDLGLEYRWISRYLQNKITLQEMKDNLYRAIIQYSKRQMTWFKRNKEIHWLAPNEVERLKNVNQSISLVANFLSS
ncbi:MAG: tRNA (adenosine(37)-N6)-dimethylallyltransferase MiaA [Patescibacteria group bacterium]